MDPSEVVRGMIPIFISILDPFLHIFLLCACRSITSVIQKAITILQRRWKVIGSGLSRMEVTVHTSISSLSTNCTRITNLINPLFEDTPKPIWSFSFLNTRLKMRKIVSTSEGWLWSTGVARGCSCWLASCAWMLRSWWRANMGRNCTG